MSHELCRPHSEESEGCSKRVWQDTAAPNFFTEEQCPSETAYSPLEEGMALWSHDEPIRSQPMGTEYIDLKTGEGENHCSLPEGIKVVIKAAH